MTVKEYNNAVDIYSDGIYRFAIKHLRNEMLADDVVQETFAKVWQKHEDIQGSKVKSYLFTTAYTSILDVIKKEKRSGDMENVSQQQAGSSDIPNFDIQQHLEQALNTLPEVQKSAVLLRDYEGYSYDEIADILELNASQVKVYIFRARKSLKAYLKRIDILV
ncbi:RNA polymerase sigma-70 factor, ECF subfamily [Lishizhenia tianjinensis]|uniref:RNA polymerase sigma-70 factor, ECF subfamily n=1 Tax=Lishizhenia tianjinensis TaxID=477690 RepID=A0A1I6ZKI4_9FLAO|nr:RNA polymerase sigma factor [Lishizhenia tianjinensis]SFT63199.1 RNA polymerase sigma-70 factor, ECF subfamily [Lishizhenia tianjinensis]